MASLTVAQLKTIADILHEWIEEKQDVCGSKDAWVVAPRPTVEQNSLQEGFFEFSAYAADASGNSMTDGQIRETIALCERAKGEMSYYEFARRQGREALRVLDKHLRNYGSGGINTILRANDERLGYWFLCAVGDKTSYPIFPFDAPNVFPPGWNGLVDDDADSHDGVDHGATWNETDPKMGKWEWTGGAEDFTTGDDIDTDLYGKSKLYLYCEVGISISTLDFDVTCKKIDETTEVKGITLKMQDDEFVQIGGASDLYIGITDITKTSGIPSNGDICMVRSAVERATKIT